VDSNERFSISFRKEEQLFAKKRPWKFNNVWVFLFRLYLSRGNSGNGVLTLLDKGEERLKISRPPGDGIEGKKGNIQKFCAHSKDCTQGKGARTLSQVCFYFLGGGDVVESIKKRGKKNRMYQLDVLQRLPTSGRAQEKTTQTMGRR